MTLTPEQQWELFTRHKDWVDKQQEDEPIFITPPPGKPLDSNMHGVHLTHDDSDFFADAEEVVRDEFTFTPPVPPTPRPEAPSKLKKFFRLFDKHYGPGDHKTGTSQDVHGRDKQSLQDRALDRRVKVSGGFTVKDPSGVMPRKGWAIALEGAELKVSTEEFTPKMFGEYRMVWQEQLERPGHHAGAWLDTETDSIFLDISIVVPTLNEAFRVGKRNNQLAVFNLETFEEVRL